VSNISATQIHTLNRNEWILFKWAIFHPTNKLIQASEYYSSEQYFSHTNAKVKAKSVNNVLTNSISATQIHRLNWMEWIKWAIF